MKESEKSVIFFSPAVMIITLLQTFCLDLSNCNGQNHSHCGPSSGGLRIKGPLSD